jgi:hypothetical protein
MSKIATENPKLAKKIGKTNGKIQLKMPKNIGVNEFSNQIAKIQTCAA